MSRQGSFSLATLGSELDAARRSRTNPSTLDDCAIEDETDSLAPLSSPSHTNRSLSATRSMSDTSERPFALCLLCLTRPPTAVLLPCCHLNLCHLCAPLLLLRHRSPSRIEDTTPIASSLIAITDSSSPPQASWNHILARATASHPKSRRLSMGGYLPPEIGTKGGEMCSGDLLACQEKPNDAAISATRTDDGRLDLSGRGEVGGAKCLMCRASVEGWLRVYTG